MVNRKVLSLSTTFPLIVFGVFLFLPLHAHAEWSWNLYPTDFSSGEVNGQNGLWTQNGSISSNESLQVMTDPDLNNGDEIFSNSVASNNVLYARNNQTNLQGYGEVVFNFKVAAETNKVQKVSYTWMVQNNPNATSSITTNSICAVTWETRTDNSGRITISGATNSFFSLGTYATNTTQTFHVKINTTNRTCTAFSDVFTTSAVSWETSTSAPVIAGNLLINNSSNSSPVYKTALISMVVGDFQLTSTSSTSYECTDCTRIISWTPDTGETIPTTTIGVGALASVYINDDDLCESILCTTKVSLAIRKADSSSRYVWTKDITTAGQHDLSHWFDEVNSAGTYYFEIAIFNDYPLFDLNKKFQVSAFYNGRPSTASELQTYASSTTGSLGDTVTFIEDYSDDPGSDDSPGVIAKVLIDIFNEFLHLPPWGYVTVFNETLQNGSTTAISDIAISFPTSSPAYGLSLTLPLESSIDDAITYINANGFNSTYGNTMDTIYALWNTIWYIAFIFWTVANVVGTFNVSLVGPRGQSQASFNRGRSALERKTIDMRSGRNSGTINMK